MFANRDQGERVGEACHGAVHGKREVRESVAEDVECRRLAMGSGDTEHCTVLERPVGERDDEETAGVEDEVGGVCESPGLPGVDDVAGGEIAVDVTGRALAHRGGPCVEERDQIVADLDLGRFDLRVGGGWDCFSLHEDSARSLPLMNLRSENRKFHVTPPGVAGSVGPDRGHRFTGVAAEHLAVTSLWQRTVSARCQQGSWRTSRDGPGPSGVRAVGVAT